jgi:TRAP-type mannitol/chloroaromatic compound transport system permease large subunit
MRLPRRPRVPGAVHARLSGRSRDRHSLHRLHIRQRLPIDLVAQRTLYALDSFPLVAVPVFLFVGSLMNSTGISRYIYAFADTAVGRMPGGLAQVNIFGSLIFAGMSGSALADIGGIGRIEIDAMRKNGFSAVRAAAVGSSAIVGRSSRCCADHLRRGDRRFGDSVLLGSIVPGLLYVAC